MGSPRPKPKRLAEKLLQIRISIDGGLSQNELIRRMNLEDELEQDRISKFERNILVPPLHILVAYSNLANIYLERLILDELDLPKNLPTKLKKKI